VHPIRPDLHPEKQRHTARLGSLKISESPRSAPKLGRKDALDGTPANFDPQFRLVEPITPVLRFPLGRNKSVRRYGDGTRIRYGNRHSGLRIDFHVRALGTGEKAHALTAVLRSGRFLRAITLH